MSRALPEGWSRESEALYIHTSGLRIERMTYRGSEGWYLVPVDLDVPPLRFEPTSEGEAKAFEAYASNAIKMAPPPKKKKPKAAKMPVPEEEPEEKDIEAEDEDEAEKEEDGEREGGTTE